jgi:adenylate cyclase
MSVVFMAYHTQRLEVLALVFASCEGANMAPDTWQEKFINIFKKPTSAKGKTILVVEDSETDQKVICRIVESAGYDVIKANDGEEGLKLAKAKLPDMVLLDCEMPKMNGVEMCRRLKEDAKLCDTPVIFITSVETPRNIIDCFELEAENYLSKPVSAKILLSQIENILGAKESKD